MKETDLEEGSSRFTRLSNWLTVTKLHEVTTQSPIKDGKTYFSYIITNLQRF